MYTIQKDFSFSAAHHLLGLPADHPCSRVHGHNYVTRIILASTTLNEVGFVRDYRELDTIKDWIDNNWDHQDLNDYFVGIAGYDNPTAECIARYLFERFETIYPAMLGVGISETPKTWAFYIKPETSNEKVTIDADTAANLRDPSE